MLYHVLTYSGIFLKICSGNICKDTFDTYIQHQHNIHAKEKDNRKLMKKCHTEQLFHGIIEANTKSWSL